MRSVTMWSKGMFGYKYPNQATGKLLCVHKQTIADTQTKSKTTTPMPQSTLCARWTLSLSKSGLVMATRTFHLHQATFSNFLPVAPTWETLLVRARRARCAIPPGTILCPNLLARFVYLSHITHRLELIDRPKGNCTRQIDSTNPSMSKR